MSTHHMHVSKETDVVHGMRTHHANSLDLVPPIHMTSTFKFRNADHGAELFAGSGDGYIYTRIGNPTTDLLQEKLAILEGAEACAATASGMAAIAAAVMTLSKNGDNFVACNSLYGGTYALFMSDLPRYDITARLISPADCRSAACIESKIDSKTRFLYMETPANPTLDVIDIEMWATVAKKHKIPLIVDNTFPTPYLTNPIALGADLVVHSGTKYLSGHGDIIGGFVMGSKEMLTHINEQYLHHFGPVMSPFNAWLFMRGVKTLAVRMEKHCDNAAEVAEFLLKHPKVERVFYPGIKGKPDYEIAKKQMKKFGAMIGFEVKGGLEAGKTVMNNVELCALAVSLGDCETLIQHPASMTHASYSPEDRIKAGISDGLIRLSVGIEHAQDIINDLENTLKKI